MSNYPPISRIAELQQLIADFAKVTRVLELGNTGRLENDVEHSFGLALTCWFLAPKIAPKLNLSLVLQYALAHDIVELHSGDTYVFDEAALKTKDQREQAALEKLKSAWPDFPELTDRAQEYKEKLTPEARFVYTIDKLLPPILINLGQKDNFWHANQVTRQMHEAEKIKKMQSSPEALPYLKLLNEWLADPDYFYKPEAHAD